MKLSNGKFLTPFRLVVYNVGCFTYLTTLLLKPELMIIGTSPNY